MVGHGGSSAGSHIADPTYPIPSHCAVIVLFKCFPVNLIVVTTSTVRINTDIYDLIQDAEKRTCESQHPW